jgi:hypothetical protein
MKEKYKKWKDENKNGRETEGGENRRENEHKEDNKKETEQRIE